MAARGEQNSFPLIGDKLPQMEVKTTHGMIKLPGDYCRKVVRSLQPPRGLYTSLHHGVRGL